MRQCLKTKYISIFFGQATDTFLLALITFFKLKQKSTILILPNTLLHSLVLHELNLCRSGLDP